MDHHRTLAYGHPKLVISAAKRSEKVIPCHRGNGSVAGSVQPIRQLALVILVSVIGILLVLTGARATVNQSMDVILLAPPGPFAVGASVPLTVDVFNYGVSANTTTLALYVNQGTGSQRLLTTTQIGTGSYQATLVIAASDVKPWGVELSAVASIGSLSDQMNVYLPVVGDAVTITPSATQILPGQRVDLAISVTLNGTAADASALLLVAYIASPNTPSTPVLNWTRTGVGSYASNYTVPTSVAEREAIGFRVQAIVGSYGASNTAFVIVSPAQRILVWQDLAAMNDSAATLDLYVANGTGSPISGAAVSLTYSYGTLVNGTPQSVTRSANGTSGANGAAVFALAYAGTTGGVSYVGTATAGGVVQGLSGFVNIPLNGSLGGLVVTVTGTVGFPSPSGPTETFNFTALHNRSSLAQQSIYYAAYMEDRLLANGTVLTDSSGNFSVTVAASTRGVNFDFTAHIGGTWYSTSSYNPAYHPLNLQVSPMVLGGTLRVTGSLPASGGPWVGLMELIGGTATSQYAYATDPWWQASDMEGWFDYYLPRGNAVDYSIVIPTFLPRSAQYLLGITMLPPDEIFNIQNTHDAYVFTTVLRVAASALVASATLSPTSLTVGETLTANASSSTDFGATITGYAFAWGDGSSTGWTANPVAQHAYGQVGNYSVTVSVHDSAGDMSNATYVVYVTASGPSGPGGVLGGSLLWIVVIVVMIAAGVLIVILAGRRRKRETTDARRPVDKESPPRE